MNNQPTRRDLYEEITAEIIKAMEAGTAPWQRPWQEVASLGTMRNLTSDQRYHGINVLILQCASFRHGYTDGRFLTFKQAGERGYKIRKGEHGVKIAYFQPLEVNDHHRIDSATGQLEKTTIPMLKTYTVFNVSQLENGPPPIQTEVKAEWETVQAAEKVLAESGAVIRHGGDRAYFSPSTGHIQLPLKAAFPDARAYFGTAFHELGHWAWHGLDKSQKFGRFGDPLYAQEEIRVELSSAFLCAEFQIARSTDDHAAYIASWIEVLQRDKREVFRAAADAQRITDYIMGRKPELQAAQKAELSEDAREFVRDYEKREQGFAATPSYTRPRERQRLAVAELPSLANRRPAPSSMNLDSFTPAS